ncbi:MAG TPA: type II toxin-antitoxin system YoeB family toxin [Sphingomicrobium sp.]|nr:type II toxin-antitoxin system YoeB family toxin [Sphingomicrobium sp.]
MPSSFDPICDISPAPSSSLCGLFGWSQRITAEDRLVYRVHGNGKDQGLEIIQCRMHD